MRAAFLPLVCPQAQEVGTELAIPSAHYQEPPHSEDMPDDSVTRALAEEAGGGYDVVLDFLWGRPAELLLDTFVPKEAGFARRRVRFVQAGQAAGPTISLAAETLRTSGLELTGAVNISPEVVSEAMKQTWEWIKDRSIYVDVDKVPLREVAQAWERRTKGTRIVIVP